MPHLFPPGRQLPQIERGVRREARPNHQRIEPGGAFMSDVVQKLWGFCNMLRHDGVDYGDYIEQLTYLLFLKMAEEKGADIPKKHSWPALQEKSGTELMDH